MSEAITKVGMAPSHPGQFIRVEIIDELNLSIGKVADVLGIRRATLSDLLNGKSSLSAEMALRVEKAFGIDMAMLLRMQAWFDTHAMRQRADEIHVTRYEGL